MGLETGTFISDLVSTNPTSGDAKSQGDDHLRLIKATLLATFPNVNGAVSATDEELSILASATESTFTPAVTFGGGSTGLTYTSRSGRYIRLGKRIFFQIRIELSAKGSSTGSANITGLPTASMATATQNVGAFYRSGFTGLTGAGGGLIDVSSTAIILYHASSTGASLMTNSEFSNSSLLYVEGFYEVA